MKARCLLPAERHQSDLPRELNEQRPALGPTGRDTGCPGPARPRRLWPAMARTMVLTVGLTVGLSLIGVLTSGEAVAQRSSGEIVDYRVELTLEASGELRVHEDFRYEQGFDEVHGFRRFIPVLVDYDDEYRRSYAITDVSATATPDGGHVTAGDPDLVATVVLAESNDNVVIRIGSADTTIAGRWRYTIDYTVHHGVETVDVAQVGAVEELAWNVVGTGWTMPIHRFTLQATFPTPPMNVQCYAGMYGSVSPCPMQQDGRQLTIAAQNLAPGEAITVYADFPVGSVSDARADLRQRWTLAGAFRPTPFTLAGSALLTIMVTGALALLLARQARDRRLVLNAYLPTAAEPHTEGLAGFFEKADGPVQFRPPDGMTPGLCGVLVDESADALDVSATVVDLAVRGYLRIEQIDESRRPDFGLRFLAEADETLNGYEAKLLEHLRAASDGEYVVLSQLRTTFATQLNEVRSLMYQETMQRRWFPRRPDTVRGTWVGLGLLALLIGAAPSVALIALSSFGLFALPLLMPGLLILATAKRMPSRTAEGRRQLELCVGYQRFLDVADAEELKFAERQYDYVAGLPYAMIFGITDRWARVLSVLQERGMDLSPTWYVPLVGYGAFRYDLFGNSMSDFASTASMALSAPKPTSTGGGFSGGGFSGGFSGGGGGGGGGGGW